MESKLSHYDESGKVSMVDVGAKAESERNATARAYIALNKAVLAALPQNKKGNPLEVARIAGIMAAKRTSDLIPLCHPLPLTKVKVELTQDENGIEIVATASTVARTGVEMEAMTAACVAALTIYDMTKAFDKTSKYVRFIYLRKPEGNPAPFDGRIANDLRCRFDGERFGRGRNSRRSFGARDRFALPRKSLDGSGYGSCA